jgi:methylmalonyl-CoA mutase N-terminal domain/subunit
MRLRFHCQTAAASLTKPQYRINIVRTGLQALAAVLGGAQSLHTNGMDEAFAIPTEEAMKIALRTQQIIADESGVADVADPLGGSYFVESLTTQYERAIFAVIDEVDRRGGTIKLTQEGWFQRRIADFAYETALKKASGEKPVLGVNKYADADERFDIALHPYDATTAERQISRLNRVRRERDSAKVAQLLDRLLDVARDENQNIVPINELVAAGASMNSRRDAQGIVFCRETPVFTEGGNVTTGSGTGCVPEARLFGRRPGPLCGALNWTSTCNFATSTSSRH